MKGNATLILLFISAMLFGANRLTAQDTFISLTTPPTGQVKTAPASAGDSDDVLEFVDGSLIHGGLKRMDASAGLRWDSPAAKEPIDLRPNHIDSIHFAHADSVAFAATSRLHFVNGDDVYGSVTSLDDNHLGFSTWFGKSLAIPRASVQSITFLSSNYTIVYEGPGDAEGWIVGNHNPESWIFRDGVFSTASAGTLGRDFKLSGSSTIEFDLAWSEPFELLVNLYSDAVDHLDYGNSYVLELMRDEAILRHVDSGRPALRTFGSAPLPDLSHKNKAHFTIQSNTEEGTVAIFVNDVLVKRWKDDHGFSAAGGGILFEQEALNGAVLKLSNIKVTQWTGRFEPETSDVTTNVDFIRLINRDQAGGKITGITGGKVSLALGETVLQIPIQRVTQINFAETRAPAATRWPWEVRAHFPRGGSVSFQLEKWNDNEVSGRSAIFGPLAFQSGQIRRLEFNLDHPPAATPLVNDREFEGLDE